MFCRRLRTITCALNSFNSVLTPKKIINNNVKNISTTIGIEAKLNFKLKQSDMQM